MPGPGMTSAGPPLWGGHAVGSTAVLGHPGQSWATRVSPGLQTRNGPGQMGIKCQKIKQNEEGQKGSM